MTLRVECVATDDGFQSLRDEWNDVLARSAANNIFLTWEWISTWWELYGAGARLYVLTARDADGTLIGIAPLQQRPRRVLGLSRVDVLEFIGSGGDVTPEQLDFIIQSGAEGEVTPAFIAHIGADRAVGGVDLRPFAAASTNLAHVERSMRAVRGFGSTIPDSVCPVLPLPATKAEFMAGRSKNYRKKMKEYQRRCVRDLDARPRLSVTAAELEVDMGTLAALHHKRWDKRTRAFRSTAYVEFHRRFAQRLLGKGWVRMFALDSPAGPVAMLYCFHYAGRFSFYQAGRDPDHQKHRVGLVLMHHAIEHAIDEHAEVFDFLRGEEDYKYMWAAGEVRAVRLAHWTSWPAWAVGRVAGLIALAQSGAWLTVFAGLAKGWFGLSS